MYRPSENYQKSFFHLGLVLNWPQNVVNWVRHIEMDTATQKWRSKQLYLMKWPLLILILAEFTELWITYDSYVMNPTTNSFLQQWYGIQSYIAFNHSLSYHQWLAINGYSSIRTIYSNLHKNATSALGQETSVNPQLH